MQFLKKSKNKRLDKLVSEVSVNACEQDKQVGNCRGHVERFFFNRTANECQLFIYGGTL